MEAIFFAFQNASHTPKPSKGALGLTIREKYNKKEGIKFTCKMLLTDCDGVLTDGGMYYSKDGEAFKKFNTKDGMAFELLRNKGILTGIITGENSPSVLKRAEKIKADEVHLGIKDKLSIVKEICVKSNISLSEIASLEVILMILKYCKK